MFGDAFRNKRVIVTGNTGFKGSWLTVWLLQLGAKVYGISKDVPTKPAMFDVLALKEKITHFQHNILDGKKVKEIFQEVQPDFVFHLAAQPIVAVSYHDPVETIATNVVGTANILEALRSLKNKCCGIIITSDKCYDNVEWTWGYRETDRLGGKDPYSASKGAAELIIKTYFHSFFSTAESPVKIVSARAGNVIGGGDWAVNRIVPDCMRAWSHEKPVELRNPGSTRPWQHVLEPLSGYLRSAQALATHSETLNGEAYNFGPNSDQNFTVQQLLHEISTHWKSKPLSNYFVFKETPGFHEAGLLKLNCDKALHQLKWSPVLNFTKTAAYTARWYADYYKDAARDDMFAVTAGQINDYVSEAKAKELEWTR